MMRDEFVSLIPEVSITDAQWEIIHTVYQFHPGMGDVHGKDAIAALWIDYGMALIMDMLPRAMAMQDVTERLQAADVALDKIKQEARAIATGSTVFDRCVKPSD